MSRITFYSESPIFGGNEKMAVAACTALGRYRPDIVVSWIVNSANRILVHALESSGATFVALPSEPSTASLQHPVRLLKKLARVRRSLRSSSPDLVVLIQGWIRDGIDGFFAACLNRTPCVSYIPMAHTPKELGVRRWRFLREAIQSACFRLIPRYITIDEQQALRLRQWNPRASVFVVENFVAPASSQGANSGEARRNLGLRPDQTVLGVIGRISFRQKAQDWFVTAVGNDPFLNEKTVLIVGDGPDMDRLRRLVESSRHSDRFHLLGWRSNLEEIYRALDLLVIPSRAEGVPLVMIEALARHIPVVGTDRDGMRSWLPIEWRFPFGDTSAMKQAITSALADPPVGYWEAAERRLNAATDERRFGSEFADALVDCCCPIPRGDHRL